jgi:hypothetical protein
MSLAAREQPILDDRIVDMLASAGRLDRASLERVTRLRASSGEPIRHILVKLGLISERDLASAIAEASGLPLVAERDYPEAPLLEDQLSQRFLRDSLVLPLAFDGETLILAMADPQDRFAIDAVRTVARCAVEPQVAVPSELERAIDRLYAQPGATANDEAFSDIEDDTLALDVEHLKDLASEAPVIRLVNRRCARASHPVQRRNDADPGRRLRDLRTVVPAGHPAARPHLRSLHADGGPRSRGRPHRKHPLLSRRQLDRRPDKSVFRQVEPHRRRRLADRPCPDRRVARAPPEHPAGAEHRDVPHRALL